MKNEDTCVLTDTSCQFWNCFPGFTSHVATEHEPFANNKTSKVELFLHEKLLFPFTCLGRAAEYCSRLVRPKHLHGFWSRVYVCFQKRWKLGRVTLPTICRWIKCAKFGMAMEFTPVFALFPSYECSSHVVNPCIFYWWRRSCNANWSYCLCF